MGGIEVEPAPAPKTPLIRVEVDEILAQARRLAVQRFPEASEALEAFFEIAAGLTRDSWPEGEAEPSATEGPGEEELEAPPPPEAEQVALLEHLQELEELLEALHKT